MIESYFNKSELEEFLQKQKIRKFELVKNYTYNELEELLILNNKNNDILKIVQALNNIAEVYDKEDELKEKLSDIMVDLIKGDR